MPKILGFTPGWLSRPSQGFQVFASSEEKRLKGPPERQTQKSSANGSTSRGDYVGPNRTIARRGTEIFVVVGNTIRWSDLCMVKEDWEGQRHERKQSLNSSRGQDEGQDSLGGSEGRGYRILNVPVYEQIRQLIPSSNGELLAIVTSHTVHIATLPPSSSLDPSDLAPIKLKTYMLGPTKHILSESSIASVLWHPLGVGGESLVTVTTEAVVRVWELNRNNRWTFDKPTLEIDLRKLAYGQSADQDFKPSTGTRRGFSLDALDMNVASACFGSTGSEAESGWCAMTLWIAMKEGDVYALCPLLPKKWQPPHTLVPSLTSTVSAKHMWHAEEWNSLGESHQNDLQYQWLTEVDKQEPITLQSEFGIAPEIIIYECPTSPSSIPRLQGPFSIAPDDEDQDLELSDIHVIASKLDLKELMDGEDEDAQLDDDQGGLSISVVCLMTTGGRVLICLDLKGIEADWLPAKRSTANPEADGSPQPELVLLEALETLRPNDRTDTEWPTFTPDVHSRYSFFTTHSGDLFYFSLESWIEGLERELRNNSTAGATLRVQVFTKGFGTLRERILHVDYQDIGRLDKSVAQCIVLQDSDLGYFLLTASSGQPYAVLLDSPVEDNTPEMDFKPQLDTDTEPAQKQITTSLARSPYQPPESLWAVSSISNFVDAHVPKRHKRAIKEEIRLSPATLEVMTEAHRVLSYETYQLGTAAADLFRRCERMIDEFRDQIHRARDVALRIDQMNDEDADSYDHSRTMTVARGSGVKVEERLTAAREKQHSLMTRHDALRKKVARFAGKGISDREKAWAAELDKVRQSLLEPEGREHGGPEEEKEENKPQRQPWRRFAEVQRLADDLLSQATSVSQDAATTHARSNGEMKGSSFKVPPNIRRNKIDEVMMLLERETALVNAAQERLQKLSITGIVAAT